MVESVRLALENGYNMIDAGYDTDIEIGKVLGKSENVFIIGKGKPSEIQGNLDDLGILKFDLYLWHLPPSNDIEEFFKGWEVMNSHLDNEKALRIGISNIGVDFLKDIVQQCQERRMVIPFANEMEISYFNAEKDLVQFCKSNSIIPIGYSPLGYINAPQLAMEDFFPTLNSLAKNYECSPHQLALAWNIKRGVCVIPKTFSLARLKDNLEAPLIAEKLTEKDFSELDDASMEGVTAVDEIRGKTA